MESNKAIVDLSEGFDPCSLIETVKRIAPELPWLPDALRNCGSGAWKSRAYVFYYVSPANANKHGDGPPTPSLVFHHTDLGDVVIDFAKGNQIYGIEFVSKID